MFSCYRKLQSSYRDRRGQRFPARRVTPFFLDETKHGGARYPQPSAIPATCPDAPHSERRVNRRHGATGQNQPRSRGILVRIMHTVPLKPERLAELEELARRRGKSTADALDDVLADYLEWERQDYREALEGIREGNADVTAGRTKPADQFLDEFARKHGLPR